MGAFALEFAMPTHMGAHESLEAGDARVTQELAEVGALAGKKLTWSLLQKAK